MKQLLLLGSLIIMGLIISCNRPAETADDASGYITLSLGVAGEAGSVDTKASTTNLYGINVYYDSAKDGNINAHYAYGLFDNIPDMSVTLLKGYHYRFACTLVKDGKNVLYSGQYGGNAFTGFAKPFQRSNSPSTAISNRFVYKSEDDDYLSGIGSGQATVKAASGYIEKNMPSIERYYGEITDYTPVTGGVVTIPLKKTVFGLRLIIEQVPEGTLEASCAEGLVAGVATATSTYDSGAHIFSFPDVSGCWAQAETYATDYYANWSFTSSKFDQWNFSNSRVVTVKRNILSTITVSYTPDNAEGLIVFNEEDFDENNIYLFLNSDGIIEIGVNPETED